MNKLASIFVGLLRDLARSANLRFALQVVIAICSVDASNSRAEYHFTSVADTTTPAPTGTFTSFIPTPAISGRSVAFLASFGSGEGIFIDRAEQLVTVAQTGDPTSNGTFVGFASPSFSNGVAVFRGFTDRGQSVFIGSDQGVTDLGYEVGREPAISGGNVAFTTSIGARGVVLAGSPGSLEVIASTGEMGPEGVFETFAYPAIHENNVSFYGGYLNENGGEGQGVFASVGGVLTTIFAQDGLIGFLYGPTSISGNTVAFYSQIDNAIYKGTGGPITTIVEEGVLAGFGDPSISGDTVAFWAAGPGGEGIFLGSGGPLTPVVSIGDSLFGSTVVDLFSGSFALDQSGNGNIAFWYRLADGRSGIAIATPVPEPRVVPLILLATFVRLLAGARVKRRVAMTSVILGDGASLAYAIKEVD